MLISRIDIYTLYYKEDQLVKNNIIDYEFNKNIKLILNCRIIYSVFLGNKTDVWKNSMLIQTTSTVKKVIKGKPTVQYYI